MNAKGVGLIAVFSCSSMGAAAAPEERVLDLDGDYTIPVSIEGQAFTMMVDPDIGSSRVLNGATAKKLALKPSMIGGRHMVGPVKLTANSNVLNYDFGDARDKKRTFWMVENAATTRADGLISASALPYKIVRFKLKASGQGEKLYSLPLKDGGNNAILIINNVEIAVGFNLDRQATVATASTGLLLSEAYDGGFTGPAVATMIRFGVERPTRPMLLKQALDVGGLPLNSVLVRVSDFGDATQIKDAESADGDEIIVTAGSKRKPRHQMELGRDFLSRCSTLTFDYRVKQVQMSCSL
jgi:hypothetical protein